MSGDVISVILRILVAGALGGLIGVDRELRGKSSGLRTNVLVAAAAAAFADTSINGFAAASGYDPSRVAAGIVSGVGFLGAGVIFASGGRPRGLTSAAALWAAASLGLAVGVGRWQTALTLVGVTLLALVLLEQLERRLLSGVRRQPRDVYVVLDDASDAAIVQEHLRAAGVTTMNVELVALGSRVGMDAVVMGTPESVDAALADLAGLEPVRYASDERGATDLAT